jgi:hypothetical protein
MPNYESYRDRLSENGKGHHVLGSSLVVVVILAIALLAVSFLWA